MTKTQWGALSEKAKWDIKVALRGPDSSYGETLKWFTTSVIRGQMRDIFRVGGLVNHDLSLVIVPGGRSEKVDRLYSEIEHYAWNYHHFIDHISTAAEHLGVPIMRIEPDLWHKVMSSPRATLAAEEILTAGEEWMKRFENPTDSRLEKLSRMGLRSPSSLYGEDHMKELARHLKSGRMAF